MQPNRSGGAEALLHPGDQRNAEKSRADSHLPPVRRGPRFGMDAANTAAERCHDAQELERRP